MTSRCSSADSFYELDMAWQLTRQNPHFLTRFLGVLQILDLGWDLLQLLHRAAPDRTGGPGADIPEPP